MPVWLEPHFITTSYHLCLPFYRKRGSRDMLKACAAAAASTINEYELGNREGKRVQEKSKRNPIQMCQ